jgi:hypothetical protein
VLEHLPSKSKILSSNPNITKKKKKKRKERKKEKGKRKQIKDQKYFSLKISCRFILQQFDDFYSFFQRTLG